jgi:nitrogen regulatory protein P-II 1
MKYIVAIIQPHRLDAVRDELKRVDVNLITVTPVLGCGRQQGETEIYRGQKEMGNLLKKVKIEIAVSEPFVQPTIDAIVRGARTGEIGDGKIFVLELSDCIRLRTGEVGSAAIG